MPPGGKCVFNKLWLENKHYKEWILQDVDPINYQLSNKLSTDEDGDEILLQYSEFLNDDVKNAALEFENFDHKTMSLDIFLASYFKEEKYLKLWNVIKIILILSHGQASVERGFSVNKLVEVENLNDESYISQRLVYDYIKLCGGIQNIHITKELRLSASSARSKYTQYLEKQRAMKCTEINSVKRKGIKDEIDYLEKKRQCLQKDITQYENDADMYSEEGEIKKDISLFCKSNMLRRTIKEKCLTLAEIVSQIQAKKDDLKNL